MSNANSEQKIVKVVDDHEMEVIPGESENINIKICQELNGKENSKILRKRRFMFEVYHLAWVKCYPNGLLLSRSVIMQRIKTILILIRKFTSLLDSIEIRSRKDTKMYFV